MSSMLVIQRSLCKTASVGVGTPQRRRGLSCFSQATAVNVCTVSEEQRSKAIELECVLSQGDIFLQGRSVRLQNRPSSEQRTAYQLHLETPECDKSPKYLEFLSPGRKKYVRKKINSELKARPFSSLNQFNESKYRSKVVPQRKGKVRTPLLMGTMNLPNENLATLPSSEASETQTREEARATLQRLLPPRDPHAPSTLASKPTNAREDGALQLLPSETSAYLQDSYDYLFQRHLQNLNNVIHHYCQQETEESSQNKRKQKRRVDIYQQCCDGDVCVKNRGDALKSESNHSAHVSSSSIQKSSRSDDTHTLFSVRGQSDRICNRKKESSAVGPEVHEKKDDNSNILTTDVGECSPIYHVETFREDNAVHIKSSSRSSSVFDAADSDMECQKINATSTHSTNASRTCRGDKKNSGYLCINVSNQFQDIHLEEAEPTISNPVITLNHVSESFSVERYAVSVSRTASRSPSPLLEVPSTVDVERETLRPPLD